jgi:hypothetical protein
LVLSSLIRKNVLSPNAKYNCNFFVHYYQLEQEASGRSGQGGAIHPKQVLMLKEHVLQQQQKMHSSSPSRIPTVQFTVTHEVEFWKQYQPFLDKIQHTKDPSGKHPLYFPCRARTYKNPTTTNNIIKMWHSIQSSWNLMLLQQQKENVKYTQVAMLRSDVLYMTPMDIYEYGQDRVVVPGFGRHLVSDRVVYGPAEAVQVWAAQRSSRLDEHIQYMYGNHQGWGLHSEKIVKFALFPAMRYVLTAKQKLSKGGRKVQVTKTNTSKSDDLIVKHPFLCFFRARADETVWVSDCDGHVSLPSIRKCLLTRQDGSSGPISVKGAVENVLGRP